MTADAKTIGVLNGPNLNLTGQREPDQYGSQSLDDIISDLRARAHERGFELQHCQSNAEHELIDAIHAAGRHATTGLIINAGAYTHTSIAIRDALLAVAVPFVEVHMSNVYARESFRHHSTLSDIAAGVIVGLGPQGYARALDALIEKAGG
ncbi:MAG: type II 3-dehydroquinate dehydratase [Pseudomonadota bacterium]